MYNRLLTVYLSRFLIILLYCQNLNVLTMEKDNYSRSNNKYFHFFLKKILRFYALNIESSIWKRVNTHNIIIFQRLNAFGQNMFN
jgi:hypothetical protein